MDPDFILLPDAEKAALISIWIIAGDRNGKIINDPLTIKKIAGLDKEPDLKKFQAIGFLVKRRRHRDATVTPQIKNRDKEREDQNPSPKMDGKNGSRSKPSTTETHKQIYAEIYAEEVGDKPVREATATVRSLMDEAARRDKAGRGGGAA